ncbi:MAG: ATP-binding protein, partial [Pseudomonadota bacterium]
RVSANLKSPLISATAMENPNVGPDTSFTADDGRLIGTAELGVHGWTIHTVTTRAALRETALALSALALFAIALVGAGVIIARQRLGLVRLQRAQNRMLEVKVTTRTRELRDEIEERKRAETALRQTQDQLIEAAKLAALGKMSAAIAHEVSQPLAALETTLASARIHAKRDDKPALDGKLVAATDMTGRLRRMLKHLKSFARRGQRVVKPVQISATIQSALAVLEPKTKEVGAAITARCAEELFAQADDIQLQQVVVNVLANALDAVQDLQTRDVSISARKHDETIVIDVRDSGRGLGTMTMDEAFEPFATSKITGEGLGLGLAITREIVEHHGGEVSIGDHVDGGAVVTITLAAADAPKPSKTAPQTA